MRRRALHVLFVLLAAFALRWTGREWMLPEQRDPDCDLVWQARLLRDPPEEPQRAITYGIYPHLIGRTAQALGDPDQREPPRTLAELREAAAAPMLQMRTVILAYSLLLVPATYLLARRFVTHGGALLAAFFAATSLLHLLFSVQARPHSAAAPLALLSVVASMRAARRGDLASFALAGAAACLALGALQSGTAVLPPLLAAAILAARGRSLRTLPKVLLAFGVAALALPIFYPHEIAKALEAASPAEPAGPPRFSGHLIFFEDLRFQGAARVLRTLRSFEPWISALALLGAAVFALTRRSRPRSAERRSDFLVVLAYVLPYLFLVSLYGETHERFVVPLVPYLACLAAWGLERSRAMLAPRFHVQALRAVTIAGALLFGGVQLAAAAKLAWLRTRPSTYAEIAAWIERNVSPERGRVEVARSMDLPLVQRDDALAANRPLLPGRDVYPWLQAQLDFGAPPDATARYGLFWMPFARDHDRLLADPQGYVATLPGDYAVVEVLREPRGPLALGGLQRALRSSRPLLVRAGPDADPFACDDPLAHQDDYLVDMPGFFLRVLRAVRLGPVIEVYRLKD